MESIVFVELMPGHWVRADLVTYVGLHVSAAYTEVWLQGGLEPLSSPETVAEVMKRISDALNRGELADD